MENQDDILMFQFLTNLTTIQSLPRLYDTLDLILEADSESFAYDKRFE